MTFIWVAYLAACSAHFASHQSYKSSSWPTHALETEPTSRFVLQVTSRTTSYCYCRKHLFPSEELFIERNFCFPCGEVPWEIAVVHCMWEGPPSRYAWQGRSLTTPRSARRMQVPCFTSYSAGPLLTLHHTLFSRELFPSLKVPVSHLPLTSKFVPRGALIFKVLIPSPKTPLLFVRSWFLLHEASWGSFPFPRWLLSLEVVIRSSRDPHLQGAVSLSKASMTSKFLLI